MQSFVNWMQINHAPFVGRDYNFTRVVLQSEHVNKTKNIITCH